MKFGRSPQKEIRTPYELQLLQRAQAMEPAKPPHPWAAEIVVPASGCTACGWDQEENLVLISSSGYSVTQPGTGQLLHRNRDENATEEGMGPDGLTFRIPHDEQLITIFGFESGDGIRLTNDGWMLEVIYPWWPRSSVVLDNVFRQGYEYLKDTVMLDLNRLDGNVRCGFSPSGKHFVILGSGGALLYSRAAV
ncbi:hypothetical protein M4D52_23070 [Paenibacillus lactis]|uniref:hypothetical protein n=1 Tax=Paenibacillus lactis TaxID=228574 RepID=UPI00203A8D37|nr:hypothetical protein [Paenibacillus lactis]MCM3496339.1 hypothetical protein [Paenibacillus lactis]